MTVPPEDVSCTLTAIEWTALKSRFNIADGHARQGLFSYQLGLMERLNEIYRDASEKSQSLVQEEFCTYFFQLANQAPWRKAVVFFHYSASLAIEAAAHLFKLRSDHVALLNPTFDNIPAILRRVGLPLEPISELALQQVQLPNVTAIFVVLPNNPTGFELTREQFADLCKVCADRGIALCIDSSFRFFSSVESWEQYQILLDSGCSFLCIEDTGKTWDLLDMKVSIVLCSADLAVAFAAISDDMLLNVSPFVLSTLTALMGLDLAEGGMHAYHALAGRNRVRLHTFGSTRLLTMVASQPCLSVALMRAESIEACDFFVQKAAEVGVIVLPGKQFWWASPELGASHMRIALLRNGSYFDRCIDALECAFPTCTPSAV